MFKRKDVYVVAAALLLALAIYAGGVLYRSGLNDPERVDVYVDGKLYISAPLAAGEIVRVEQADGRVNALRLTEDGFYMEYSTCKNQLCVEQGCVTKGNYITRALGAHILCLPNRVDARLAGADDALAPDA